jgi:hypothetical protein
MSAVNHAENPRQLRPVLGQPRFQGFQLVDRVCLGISQEKNCRISRQLLRRQPRRRRCPPADFGLRPRRQSGIGRIGGLALRQQDDYPRGFVQAVVDQVMHEPAPTGSRSAEDEIDRNHGAKIISVGGMATAFSHQPGAQLKT